MKRILYLNLILCLGLSLAYCSSNSCEEFSSSTLMENINKVVVKKNNGPKDYSNIVKVVFTRGIEDNNIYVTIRDDIGYSEEANNFELDGYLIINNTMVGFYNTHLFKKYNDYLDRCLLRSPPPKNYTFKSIEPVSVNWWMFEILENESLKILDEGVNRNLQVSF